jgi:hypothetical protein
LQHKAKGAQVVAAANVDVKGGVSKFEAEGQPFGSMGAKRLFETVPSKANLNLIIGGIELHVNDIFDRLAVDGQHFVTRLQAEAGGEGIGGDGLNESAGLVRRYWYIGYKRAIVGHRKNQIKETVVNLGLITNNN